MQITETSVEKSATGRTSTITVCVPVAVPALSVTESVTSYEPGSTKLMLVEAAVGEPGATVGTTDQL